MATDFTNKYMQVFQTYDEFGEHSADYVKGEDHLAYLIQENEVIYWLYLEQVWRPLNVRTTTTGELEDGRSKVAVRLEYVEGGQKYTSVPNIPDPERITSMANFLEDYPDIEEVNVTGTVNLTDLSYAFAGSKIRDFSKLDTSKVNNLTQTLYNLQSVDNNFIINSEKTSIICRNLCNKGIRELTLNIPNCTELHSSNITIISGGTINKLNINCKEELNLGVLQDDTVQIDNIICNGSYTIVLLSTRKNFIENITGNEITFIKNNDGTSPFGTYNIECNKIILSCKDNLGLNTKFYLNKCNEIILDNKNNNYINFKFGGGIYNANALYNIKNSYVIGNFVFTTPVVDDDFYAKYNHPISIFQYKTTFEEVADVRITEATDSSLIYVNWNNINFDTSNMNIEINNNIGYDCNNNSNTFNIFKLDNNNIEYDDYNNMPLIRGLGIDNLNVNEGIITGNYKIDVIYRENNIFNNVNLYFYNVYELLFIDETDNPNWLINNNVHIYYKDNLHITTNNNFTDIEFIFDIKNIHNNNNPNLFIGVFEGNYNTPYNKVKFKYYDDINIEVKCNTTNKGYILNPFYYYLLNSSIDKPIILGMLKYEHIWAIGQYSSNIYVGELNDVYINCEDDCYIYEIIYIDDLNDVHYCYPMDVENIHGIINIGLHRYYTNKTYPTICESKLKHIDINKVFANVENVMILEYINVDDETTIGLITQLVDNANNNKSTIYMYRSQANIIGEDNIAAAVAKNYEFAIIEN